MGKVDPYNCCEPDDPSLDIALGDDFTIIYEYLWGGNYEHSYDGVYKVGDRYISASCGGCSCGGSGDWSWYDTLKEAWESVPEYHRTGANDSRIMYRLDEETGTIIKEDNRG